MADWKIVKYKKRPEGYHIEVGIEAVDGGWEQVRSFDFALDAFAGTAITVAKAHRKSVADQLVAEWNTTLLEAAGTPPADGVDMPGVGGVL
jgi:hypothetical protein